jgi:hypothetical protein
VKEKAEVKKKGGDESKVLRPIQAGFCMSIYDATFTAAVGKPAQNPIYYGGFVVALFQLGIAATPCGLFGD